MDLQVRKYEFIRELIKLDKSNVMDKLEQILYKEQTHEGIDIEEYNRSINQSLEEIKQGKVYTHEQVGEHIKQWVKR